jgi:hypothetical protein
MALVMIMKVLETSGTLTGELSVGSFVKIQSLVSVDRAFSWVIRVVLPTDFGPSMATRNPVTTSSPSLAVGPAPTVHRK